MSTIDDWRPSSRINQRMGMFSLSFRYTTNLCFSSFVCWFSGILKSLDRDLLITFPWVLPTQEYYTKAALFSSFSISNSQVSMHHVGDDACINAFPYRIGPLTTSWCMRMEAKNSYFKKIAQQGNFKNISLSVARHHQKLTCALIHDDDFFEKLMSKSNGT